MNFTLVTLTLAAGLFLGMLICLEVGWRIGRARLPRDPEGIHKGFGVVEGSIFALLGLIIAFTFSGAALRYDHRRQLIGEETNAIGTAYLRIDVAPVDVQPELRELFRRYVDTRLEVFQNAGDLNVAKAKLAESEKLQKAIWTKASSACQRPGLSTYPAMLLLQALNQMIDITTTRTVATQTHPPKIIFFMLGAMGLICALLAGYSMAASKFRSWLHTVAFAVIIALTIYVIIDLEFPRLGLIRVEEADQVLIHLRDSMQ